MVGVLQRMHKLKALLSLRHGPGAAILPPEITMIHMDFATKWRDGHFGPRKFWRACLPRLKYWNPTVPMIVNRTNNQEGPATMTIYFRQQSSASSAAEPTRSRPPPPSTTDGTAKASAPADGERIVTLDMKRAHSDTILSEFLTKTGAVPVVPTPAEEADIEYIRELRERGAVDREVQRKFLEAERREAAMIRQARNEAAAMKQNA